MPHEFVLFKRCIDSYLHSYISVTNHFDIWVLRQQKVQLKPPAAFTRVAHFLGRRDKFAHFPAQNICNQATTRPIPPQSRSALLTRQRHQAVAQVNTTRM
ncbi:hypothetical protein SRHO_G00083080 [Serrasalmus rhombeus]